MTFAEGNEKQKHLPASANAKRSLLARLKNSGPSQAVWGHPRNPLPGQPLPLPPQDPGPDFPQSQSQALLIKRARKRRRGSRDGRTDGGAAADAGSSGRYCAGVREDSRSPALTEGGKRGERRRRDRASSLMPKRKNPLSLERLCLENVIRHMEWLWVKAYAMDDNPSRRHSHDTKGPLSLLAGYHLQELLQIMRERQLLTPTILHVLLWPQLKELNLSSCSQHVDKTIAQLITVRCTNLSSLILRGCNQIPADALVDLVKASPCLTKLNLASTQCNTQVLCTIRSFCPELCELDITACKRLPLDSLLQLAYDPTARSYCCQSLQTLSTEGLAPSTDRQNLLWVLVFVLLALPNLQYLNHHFVLHAVCLIHDQQFQQARIPAGFPSLEEVALYRTCTHPKEERSRLTLPLKQIYNVFDSLLPQVGAVCPHLSEVSVILRNSCGLDQYLSPWRNLVHLIISGKEENDLKELLPVTEKLGTQLKRLSFDGIILKDALTIHTLLSHCPNLLKFAFLLPSPQRHGRDRQPETEAPDWDLSLPPLKLPQLSEFSLVYTDVGEPLPSRHVVVLKNVLVSVFRCSPCLETLNLLCLPFSLDQVFQKALNPPSTALQHLRQLSLLQAQISIHTINLLCSSENQLSVLSLEKCLNINQKDYKELLQRINKENFELVIKWE